MAFLYGLCFGAFIPALVSLGYQVRECTWNGGVNGTVKGDAARAVIEGCLALQMQLLQDWRGCDGSGYPKAMATALLCWTPWHDKVPGRFFVEEVGEALLSRLGARLSDHPHVNSFEGWTELYQSLPAVSEAPRNTRGAIKQDTVTTVNLRLRNLIGSPGGRPFFRMKDVRVGRWEREWDLSWESPSRMPDEFTKEQMVGLLRSAVVLVTTTTPMSEKLHRLLDQYPGRADPDHLYDWQTAMVEVNRWARDRDASRPPRARPGAKPAAQLAAQPRAKPRVARPRVKPEPKPLAAPQGSLLGGPALGIDDDNSLYGSDYDITAVSATWRSSGEED